jgi:hypothetical protein
MTEAEAIKFLQFRQRHMRGGENLSSGEIISLIRRSNVSLIVSGSSLLSSASIILLSNHRSGHGPFFGAFAFFGAAAVVLGFIIIGFSTWSHIRLRQACHALNYATDGSSRLSGSK